MPKKSSKKFIDKNSAVTFHLVHRSQQDPLTADENAPQRVLVPLQEQSKPFKEKKKRIEKQQRYGIFFDDEYNYLQHLRDVNNTTEWVRVGNPQTVSQMDSKIELPSSVFASNVEEEVGLLNKAAPTGLRLDIDPDIVAALDEDFDFDDPNNQLDDNFMEFANASDAFSEESDDDYDSEEVKDEIASLNCSLFSFENEETKSRFTDYSMSSSVIRRNDQLTLLDDRFEKMYSGYDDNEIGALDCDEIEGDVCVTSGILLSYADEFNKQSQKEYLDNNALALRLRLQQECATDSNDDPNFVAMRIPEKEKWDCESILTTYSNIYNHPKIIMEPKDTKIKINPKTGIPKNVLNSNKLTAKALLTLDEQYSASKGKNSAKSIGGNSVISMLSTLSIRNRNESLDEKRKRKRLLKEYRRERRHEKKNNVKAFREERVRQTKITINSKNVQGNKIL